MIPALLASAAAAAPTAAKLGALKAAAATPAAASAGSLISALLALMLVVGLILGLAWLLRRMPGNAFNGQKGLRPVASLALGAKERLVVVEVGGEQLLIGVTSGGMSLLHKLPSPLPEAAAPVNFSELLAKRLGKSGKAA